MVSEKCFFDFLCNAFNGKGGCKRCAFQDRISGFGFDFKAELGRKANGSEHSKSVFLKTIFRVSDRPDHAAAEIL